MHPWNSFAADIPPRRMTRVEDLQGARELVPATGKPQQPGHNAKPTPPASQENTEEKRPEHTEDRAKDLDQTCAKQSAGCGCQLQVQAEPPAMDATSTDTGWNGHPWYDCGGEIEDVVCLTRGNIESEPSLEMMQQSCSDKRLKLSDHANLARPRPGGSDAQAPRASDCTPSQARCPEVIACIRRARVHDPAARGSRDTEPSITVVNPRPYGRVASVSASTWASTGVEYNLEEGGAVRDFGNV
ncbi:hypothetical protein K491DRAFT_673021 [Lophiostoma macrostomum CBS 122681]|uniref:Uncharacterized protein n=1 Tax=Lophiostoma macrostomum CBS 122681 TaxID=1314788 RepID=A0A6A6TR06_9PLEO|nr:hypothetical protein K491DRAFT_673021 [Lophiostoma macrostomum CBS 122681]